MNVEENNNHSEAEALRRDCSTCIHMPSCWMSNVDYALGATKACWKPKRVTAAIKK